MTDRIYYSREAAAAARRQQLVSSLAILILGAGIGATISLLFSPQGGEETRNQIEEGINRGLKAANDALKQLASDRPDLREEIERVLSNIRA